MASDSRQGSKPIFEPKSAHTSDAFLQDFLDPSFDAVSYLNGALRPVARKPGGGTARVPLAELSSQAQTLQTQLDAHTTRLSGVLTQLTDEMLRSGSRLAYEVEVLRGEATGLEEAMTERLREEISMFVPGGLNNDDQKREGKEEADDPEYIKKLQTLTLVRARLDSVIKTFGDAMEFVFPPSETSLSSGFLSVSAPDPGAEQQSSEAKGQQVLRALREEVSNLLYRSEDPVEGVEKAAERVGALKELAVVWRGTAEEKGRNRFVEGLAKMVEDRHRELLREADASRREGGGRQREDGRGSPAFGLMGHLQKLRGT